MLYINDTKYIISGSERLRKDHVDDFKSKDGQLPQPSLYIKSDSKFFVKGNINLFIDFDKKDML